MPRNLAKPGTSAKALHRLARKVESKSGWEDIVLPPNQLAQLRRICTEARSRNLVYEAWGCNRRISPGKGLNVLFTGAGGTGKTIAAQVIARELRLDLFRVNRSQIVSKYIEETEKSSSASLVRHKAATRFCFLMRPMPCLGSGRMCATPTTATLTLKWHTCCKGWRSTRASAFWPQICAIASMMRSCGDFSSSSSSLPRTTTGGQSLGLEAAVDEITKENEKSASYPRLPAT